MRYKEPAKTGGGVGHPFFSIREQKTSSTSFVDVGLENETTYCYQLTASNVEGTSEPTDEVCATTLPQVQAFLRVQDPDRVYFFHDPSGW